MADNNSQEPSTETTESLYGKAVEKLESDPYIVSDSYRIDNFNLAASMFDQVEDYLDAPEKAALCREKAAEAALEAKEKQYRNALRRMEKANSTDKMEKVRKQLQELGDYKDAPKVLADVDAIVHKGRRKSAIKRGIVWTLILALVIFIIAGSATGFFKYMMGFVYMRAGAYTDAEAAFEKMGSFLDSETNAIVAREKAVAGAAVGDVIPFGHYRWRVLSIDGDEMLMIGASIGEDSNFYQVVFSEDDPAAGWADSSLRAWLNGEVYEEGFTDRERARILCQEVPETVNESCGTKEEGTKDYLTLLSAEDCEVYQEALQALSLDYYLRTPGEDASKQAYVSGGSREPMLFGCPKDTVMAVRPVIRIDLTGLEGRE